MLQGGRFLGGIGVEIRDLAFGYRLRYELANGPMSAASVIQRALLPSSSALVPQPWSSFFDPLITPLPMLGGSRYFVRFRMPVSWPSINCCFWGRCKKVS